MTLESTNFPSTSAAEEHPPTAHQARPRPSISATYLTNVPSMSNPLDVSQTHTSTSVKCHSVHHDSDSLLSSPETRTKSITTGATSSFDKRSEDIISIQPVRRAATFGENSPLLSERESIFATHYLPSDGNDQTPRLPAAEGADDVADLPQDLNTIMEVALPSSPPHSSVALQSLLSPRKSRPTQIVQNVGQKKPTNLYTPTAKRIDESSGIIHTVRRVASEGHSRKQILQLRVTDPNLPLSAGKSRNTVGRREMGLLGNDGEEVSGKTHDHSQPRRERGSARRETFRQTGSKERSSSRGRARVEKSIEATLPDREPTKNVRTRKSSHLMGIFKETTPSETKKRDGQNRMGNIKHEEEERSVDHLEGSGVSQLRSQSAMFKPFDLAVEETSRRSVDVSDRLSGLFGDLPIYAEPAMSDTPNGPPSMPVSPSKTEHDPYFRKRDELKHSMGGKPPVIPAKLLEDIRKHHNLTPAGERGTTLSHSLLSTADVDQSKHSTSTKDAQEGDAEGRNDEDEEHITSAVYFPHPGPSEEDIEQFTSPDEEQKGGSFPAPPSSATPTPKAELKRTLSDTLSPEHIDISVRSNHEQSVFHGDYRPVGELSDGDVERRTPGALGDTATDSASSASESDLSSGEEVSDLGHGEGGEVTPTSTPMPQGLLQRRKRSLKAAAPKGAVVLEPYSHQVGGHSTMFRFSRRAVCKQLNNRENEFYERIEQRHPDMLRFLPRLVTDI